MASIERIKFGDLPAIVVTGPSKASVRIALLGGTVYSFVTSDGIERMYVSSKVITDGSKGIRGGIPIVFPQFGPGRLKQHGFARWMPWEFDESSLQSKGDKVTVEVNFSSNERTRELWNFEYLLTLKISFTGSCLETTMTVVNKSPEKFRFQYLLHTYHLLPVDIEDLVIEGVDGMKNFDKLKSIGEMLNYFKGKLLIKENHDSIYANESLPNRMITVSSSARKKLFTVEVALHEGNIEHPADVVIWNPWIQKAKDMVDFGDTEYRQMVCIEPGCVSRYESCLPDKEWSLYQKITYL